MSLQNTNQTNINTSQHYFRILFDLFWIYNTFFKYILFFVYRLPIINMFKPFIVPIIIGCLICFSYSYMRKNANINDILFYLMFGFATVYTIIFYPKNEVYILNHLWRIFGASIPIYFFGLSYNHSYIKKDLFWLSLISVCVGFLYFFYSSMSKGKGDEMLYDMDRAYKMLPSIMYLLYWAFSNKGLHNKLIAVPGAVLAFTYGTRGPILAIIIFLAICIFIRFVKETKILLKIMYIFIAVFVAYNFLSLDKFTDIAINISKTFEDIGFSTRIFDYFVEGEIATSSGRDSITNIVISAIEQKMILGYGLMGDRVLAGTYSHNLFLEVWCEFGVIIGTVLLVSLFIIIFKALYKCRKDDVFYFLLAMCVMMIVKLMLSGSYIFEPYFYLMLGMCVANIRRKERNFDDENCTN